MNALLCFCIFYIKKESFLKPDGLSITLNEIDIFDEKLNITSYYLKKTFLSQTNSGNVSKTCFLRNPKRKYPVPNLSSTRKQRQMNMTLRMDSVPFFSPLSQHLKPTRLNLRTLLGLNQQNTKLTMPNALISNTFQYQSLENI